MKKKHEFEELSLPRRSVTDILVSRYRVYKDPDNYTLVDADNAQDAIKNCGMEKVHRIERDSIYLDNILNMKVLAPVQDMLVIAPAVNVATKPPLPAIEAPQQAAPVEPQQDIQPLPPAADAPLSSDEVSKLLGN